MTSPDRRSSTRAGSDRAGLAYLRRRPGKNSGGGSRGAARAPRQPLECSSAIQLRGGPVGDGGVLFLLDAWLHHFHLFTGGCLKVSPIEFLLLTHRVLRRADTT